MYGIAFLRAACGTWIRYEDIQLGLLKGHVYVEWYRQDKFIYRRDATDPLLFVPTFMKTPIDPHDMYTDGGSVPQVLWGIPGLSPWALGPAYIMRLDFRGTSLPKQKSDARRESHHIRAVGDRAC
jgi:hypothetical protein